jgi:hypothetical protein
MRPKQPRFRGQREAFADPKRGIYARPYVELLLTTVGPSDARRLCPLDTSLLQCPNSPGKEELPR